MDDNNNSVEAARARLEKHRSARGDMNIDASAQSLRAKIIELFSMILWVALAIGVLGALWSLLRFDIPGAVSSLVTTIVTVGVGFVVLDIRDRLMR